jgi:hypothetical protein
MLTGRKIGVVVVTILLLVSGFIPLVEMDDVDLGPDDSVVADVLAIDLLPDPDLQDSPDVTVEGSSGEFSYNHDVDGVNLTWSHIAGTALVFRAEAVEGLSDCLDFIYFVQEFDWIYDQMPADAFFEIDFKTMTTGSFLTEEYASLMFKLYVWLIDSSGNWIQIYRSYPPYVDMIQTRRVDLSYFPLRDAFGGMIEDETGVQEDPEDSLSLAVGLAPTSEFEYYAPAGINPWEDYTGTVSFTIDSLEFTALLQTEDDPSLGISPIFNNTWSKNINEVFPVPPLAGSASDWARDVATDDDGSVYVVGYSGIPYEYYEVTRQSFRYQTLLKFDARTNLLWRRHLENQTDGHAICVDGGFIYTSGETFNETGWSDAITAKYTTSGQLLWKRIWDNGADEIGDAITVTPDGTVYVVALTQNIRDPPPDDFLSSVLLKYSPSGELLTNVTLGIPYFQDQSEIRATDTGLYLWEGVVTYRDFNGEIVWITPDYAHSFTVSQDGILYTAKDEFGGEGIEQIRYSKWNPQGNLTWNSTFSIPYSGGFYERLLCGQIASTPDGSLIGLLMKESFDFGYVMVKFSPAGELVWNKTVLEPFFGYWIPSVHLRVASTGLAYAVGYWAFDIQIAAYDIGHYSIPVSLGSPLTLGLLGGGVVITAAAFVYWKRRRQF